MMKPMLCLLLAAVIGCKGGSKKPDEPPSVAAPAPAPVAVVAPPLDAAPTALEIEAAAKARTDADRARLALKRFDVKEVLGRTRAQIKTLGRGVKGPDGMVYELGDEETGLTVRLEFDENAKAGVVAITGHEYVKTEEVRDAMLAAAGVTSASVEWRIPSGEMNIEIWDPGALARATERKRVAAAVGDYMNRIGTASGHSRGELETVMLVRVRAPTICTRSVLTEMKHDIASELEVDFRKLGFVTIQCDLDGPSITAR